MRFSGLIPDFYHRLVALVNSSRQSSGRVSFFQTCSFSCCSVGQAAADTIGTSYRHRPNPHTTFTRPDLRRFDSLRMKLFAKKPSHQQQMGQTGTSCHIGSSTSSSPFERPPMQTTARAVIHIDSGSVQNELHPGGKLIKPLKIIRAVQVRGEGGHLGTENLVGLVCRSLVCMC
jgi:hypothetical protein